MSGTRANTQVRWLCHPAKWKSQGSVGWCRESNSSSACSQEFWGASKPANCPFISHQHRDTRTFSPSGRVPWHRLVIDKLF